MSPVFILSGCVGKVNLHNQRKMFVGISFQPCNAPNWLSPMQSEEKTLPEERKEDQKAVDAKLVPLIEAVPELKSYLSARFSLKSGVKPHELVF